MTPASNESHAKDVAEKDERETPAERGVAFPTKKRSRKSRTKLQFKEEDSNAGEAAGEAERPEITVSEMNLLKEAQELREQSRIATLTAKGSDERTKAKDKEDAKVPADDPIGLRESFAVEKSSHIAEERMSRYIEERMVEKFKERRREEDRRSKPEDDIFAIPDRLKVEEKPLYDPGEGLPAAGVEEVALPDEARLRNEEETRRAHEALRKKAANAAKRMDHIPGNLSANFAKHRDNWMQDNTARFGDAENRHRAEDGEKRDKSVGEDTAKRRRYQTASDAVVADRFRKRWKR